MDTLDSDPAGPGLAPSLGIVGGSLVTLQPRQDPEETKACEVQQHVQGHTSPMQSRVTPPCSPGSYPHRSPGSHTPHTCSPGSHPTHTQSRLSPHTHKVQGLTPHPHTQSRVTPPHTYAIQGHTHPHTHTVQTHTHIFPVMYSTLSAVFSL